VAQPANVPPSGQPFIGGDVGRLMLVGALVGTLVLNVRASAPAWAGVMIRGAGGESCGTWTQDINNLFARSLDQQWVLGYVSGVAYAINLNLVGRADPGAVTSWIDNYCASHPLDPLAFAANRLIDLLRVRVGERR